MKHTLLTLSFGASLLVLAAPANADEIKPSVSEVVRTYTDIVYHNYKDAYQDGKNLQTAINAFLDNPTETNLATAKKFWLISRNSYGQTEAFRFYEGPIDFADENGNEGPEGRLNAWPLDEAYIDYVAGNSQAGIVNDPEVEITKAMLTEKNQADDEAEVATGYHAIEFLLWGQDLSVEGPGNRPVSDYAKDNPFNERRREYLRVVTELLVDDLKFLADSWVPDEDNFATKFEQDEQALSKMMTALATLSGFELASERMATSLDSGDQEDEHSCFSDNTHNDFIYNAKGVANVYFGEYAKVRGQSIHDLIMAKDAKLAEQLKAQLKETEMLMASLPHPIDREILSTPQGSPAREQMEKAVSSLQKQADLFKKAGKALGVDVQINE